MICPTIKTHVENLTRRKTRIMYENVNFFFRNIFSGPLLCKAASEEGKRKIGKKCA